MLSVTDGVSLSRALNSTIQLRLKHLLVQRCNELGGDIADRARFIVMEAHDRADDLERELGLSVLSNFIDRTRFGDPGFSPCFEWLVDHGFAYEFPFILTDDGFAHVVIIEKAAGIDPNLKALCEAYADAAV